MDCKQIRELMWENDLPEEFFEHIEACPECKSEYELARKTKTALSSRDDLKERILVAATLEKRRRIALNITRIAASLMVVLAVGIFAKLAIDSGMKTAEDCEAELPPTLGYDRAESMVGTTNGFGELLDGVVKDEAAVEEAESSMPYQDKPIEAPTVELEEAVIEEDVAFEDDACMLMNVYKDMHELSYHTADIVVAGDDLAGVINALSELGAQRVDSHIEIEGDFYFEVQDCLARADFDILFVSSSESVKKTLIYLEDLIK